LRAPATLELPEGEVRLAEAGPYDLRLSPWPFAGAAFEIEGLGRPLPQGGRFADEAAMRVWIASPERQTFRTRLAPG
jgi:hypothetical protein